MIAVSRPLTHPLPGAADATFEREVCLALAQQPPRLPCKYFYDARGAELFEEICRLPEYYPTRTEQAIYDTRGGEIAAALPTGAELIEYGSGEGTKTERLIEVLQPAAYLPVDVAGEQLQITAARLRLRFPGLLIAPVQADFTTLTALPPSSLRKAARVVFFPGSTIGNFLPLQAIRLLSSMRQLAGNDGALVVGFDRIKDPAVLAAAYNDSAGVTAAFNKNLITRLRRELAWSLSEDDFAHRAVWNADRRRIEMHLVSLRAQLLPIAPQPLHLPAGSHIVTEYSHKYDVAGILDLAQRAGLRLAQLFSDPAEYFSVALLRPASA